jgi:choline dehydrogenase-like flavoprotein
MRCTPLTRPGGVRRALIRRLADGVGPARQLASTSPLAEHIGDSGDTDADLLSLVGSYQHPVGTCRIGPDSDPYAFVDSTGRVRGVGNLAVCDASVMPAIPSANTNLPTLMVALMCQCSVGGPHCTVPPPRSTDAVSGRSREDGPTWTV